MSASKARRGRTATGVAAVVMLGALVASTAQAGASTVSSHRQVMPGATTTTTSPPTTTAVPGGPTLSPTDDDIVPSFGPSTSFGADQQWLEIAIGDRVSQLGLLTTKLANSSVLTDADRAALEGMVAADQATLATLSSSVDSATTASQLHTAAVEMIEGLHVYAILTPQVDLVLSADSDSAAAGSLQALEADLSTAVAASHANRQKLTRLHALIRRFDGSVGGAASAAGPLPGKLLALGETDLSAAQPVLVSAGASLKSAGADLDSARSSLRTILSLLSNPSLSANTKRQLRRGRG